MHHALEALRQFARSILERIPAEVTIALTAAGVLWVFKWLAERLRRWRFRRVFGTEAKEFYLAFGSLIVNSELLDLVRPVNPTLARFPMVKMSHPNMAFSAEKLASNCEIRAVAYVGATLNKDGGFMARVVTDDSIDDRLDADFISFGALSNLKTLDALRNPANEFVEYDSSTGYFVSKVSHQPLYHCRAEFDYGIILKMHPIQFLNRTWLSCAGVGEWGTSGASWFLANKWKEIAKEVKHSDQFVCVIEVRIGQDESARLLSLYKTASEMAAKLPTA